MTTITAAMVKTLRERTGAAMMACKNALQEAGGDLDAAGDILRKAGDAKAAKRADKIAAEGSVVIALSDDAKQALMLEMNSETDFVARSDDFANFAQTVATQALSAQAADVEAALAVKVDGMTLEEMRKNLINKIGENVQFRRVALLNAQGMVGQYCHGGRIGVIVALNQANADLAKDVAMHIAAANPKAVSEKDVPPEILAKEKEIYAAQEKDSGKPDNIIEKIITGRLKKFLKEITLLDQPFVKDDGVTVGELLKKHNAEVSHFVRFEVGEGIEKVTQDFASEVMSQVQGNE